MPFPTVSQLGVDFALIGPSQQPQVMLVPVSVNQKLVFGPFPADGFFASGMHQQYDGILAMYHDQGLVAFKTLAFETGVNFTAGLPFVRTSPDHGTAYSIAGKNQANENSFRQAMYLAADIIKNRSAQTVEK